MNSRECAVWLLSMTTSGASRHDFAPIEGGVEEGIGEGDDEEEEDSPAVGEDMTELPEADLPEVTHAESERSDDIHRSIKRYSRHSGGTSSDEVA